MIEYIVGTLTYSTAQKITVETGGMGYGIFIALSTFEKLPQLGSEVKIFVSTVFREDSQKMFGFLTRVERDFFETLNEISGIGPRLATAILGHMTLEDLHLAVEQGNAKMISKIPGIGKKMSERLILELRDKFAKIDLHTISLNPKQQQKSAMSDAISALINLGYNPLEAQKTVKNILSNTGEDVSLPELISLALKAKKV